MELVEAIGRPLESTEGRRLLQRFRALRPEVLDLAPDEGLPPDHYLSSPDEGISIKHTAAGRITDVFLMAAGKDAFAQFAGALPEGLSFADTPLVVQARLGAPSFRRDASAAPFAHGTILRYDRPGYSLHVQFREDRPGIELVTVMDRPPDDLREA